MTAESAPVPRVLFVCTGNTCRSVLAEYLAREAFGDSVDFESAGISQQTAADAENAVFTLKNNFWIDASMHVPRDIRALDLQNYNLIIALESHVRSMVLRFGVPDSRVKLWKVKDPWGPDLGEYDRASLEIKRKIAQLKASQALN